MEVVGFVYMLECKDGCYYVGSHRGDDPAQRVWEHNAGVHKHAYTFTRRPVELIWCEYFYRYDEMVAVERQIKGWSRAKKEALIRGDGAALRALSARGVRPSLLAHPSRRIDQSQNDQSSSG
jgi:putative endonuclease